MAADKGIVRTFPRPGKTAEPIQLTQRSKLIHPAGEQLVHITLMAHIVDDLVFRRLKHAVDGCGDLHNPQIGGQMPSCEGQASDEEKPDLSAEIFQLFLGELSHIIG